MDPDRIWSTLREEGRDPFATLLAWYFLPSPPANLWEERVSPARKEEKGLLSFFLKEKEGDLRSAILFLQECSPFSLAVLRLKYLHLPFPEIEETITSPPIPLTPRDLLLLHLRKDQIPPSFSSHLLSLPFPEEEKILPFLLALPSLLSDFTQKDTLLASAFALYRFHPDPFLRELTALFLAGKGEYEKVVQWLLETPAPSKEIQERDFHLLSDLLFVKLKNPSLGIPYLETILNSPLGEEEEILKKILRYSLRNKGYGIALPALTRLFPRLPEEEKELWVNLLGYGLLVEQENPDLFLKPFSSFPSPFVLLALKKKGEPHLWISYLEEIAGTTSDRSYGKRFRIRQKFYIEKDRQGGWQTLGKVLEEGETLSLLYLKLWMAEGTRRFHDAVETLKKLEGKITDPKEILNLKFRRAQIYEMALNEEEKAISTLKEILELHPNFLPAVDALERIYLRRQEYSSLLPLLEKKVEWVDDPERKLVLLEEMAFLYGEVVKDIPKTLSTLERILEINPQDKLTWIYYMALGFGTGKGKEVWKFLKGLLFSETLPEPAMKEVVNLLAQVELFLFSRPSVPDANWKKYLSPSALSEWAVRVGNPFLSETYKEQPHIFTSSELPYLAEENPHLSFPSNPYYEEVYRDQETLLKEKEKLLLREDLGPLPFLFCGKEPPSDLSSPYATLFKVLSLLKENTFLKDQWEKLPPPWKELFQKEIFPLLPYCTTNLPYDPLIPLSEKKDQFNEETHLGWILALLRDGKGELLQGLLPNLPPSLLPLLSLPVRAYLFREKNFQKALKDTGEIPQGEYPALLSLYLLEGGETGLILKELLTTTLSLLEDPSLRRELSFLLSRVSLGLKDLPSAQENLLKAFSGETSLSTIQTLLTYLNDSFPLPTKKEILTRLKEEPYPPPIKKEIFSQEGKVEKELGERKLAIEAFTKALKIDGKDASLREELRTLLEEENIPEEEVECILEGLLYPSEEKIRKRWYERLSRILSEKDPRFFSAFQKGMEEFPRWDLPYRMLLKTPLDLSRKHLYLKTLLDLTTDEKEKIPLYLELGEIQREEGNRESAWDLFLSVVKINPAETLPLKKLEVLAEEEGKWEPFLNILKEVEEKLPEGEGKRKGEICLQRGEILFSRLNKKEEGFSLLKEGLQKYGNLPSLLKGAIVFSRKLTHPVEERLPWIRIVLRERYDPEDLTEWAEDLIQKNRYDFAYLLTCILKATNALSGVGENIYRQKRRPLSPPSVERNEEEWSKTVGELCSLPPSLLKIFSILKIALENRRETYVGGKPRGEKVHQGTVTKNLWEKWSLFRGAPLLDWYTNPEIDLPTVPQGGNAILLPENTNQENLYIWAVCALETYLYGIYEWETLPPEEQKKVWDTLKEGKEAVKSGGFLGKKGSQEWKELEESLPRKNRKELEDLLKTTDLPPDPPANLKDRFLAGIVSLVAPDPGEFLKPPLKENISSLPLFPKTLYDLLLKERTAQLRVQWKFQS